MNLPIFGVADKKSTAVLPEIFGVEAMPRTVAKSVRVVENNRRAPIARTLTKAEVRGGGRKPFRQKGTGNGRQGSIRNPHYKGGGVAFGRTGIENWSRSMPVKERRLALFSALSMLAEAKKLGVVVFPEATKLRELADVIASLPATSDVVIFDTDARLLGKLIGNLPGVSVVDVRNIQTHLLMKARFVYFTQKALEAFTAQYTVSSKLN